MSYYLSTTKSKTSNSLLLGVQNVGSLSAGTSVTIVTSLAIPATTSAGTFYVVGLADSNAVVKESCETNNSASSGAISVKDSTPPTISAVTSSGATASSATITWKTDEPSSSEVEYGIAAAYGSVTALATSLVTNHSVTLSGLTAGSVYHFRVHSKDSAGNEAQSGDSTFTTASPAANAIATTGPTYYVATNGDDANPGTETQPFRTISHGVSRLTPGDTLYVMSGTYAEVLPGNIPSGSSWSAPVTVAAYPGNVVTIKPNATAWPVLYFAGQQYIIIDGFILDAINVTYAGIDITYTGSLSPAHHIRIQNCDLKNSPGQGVLVATGASYNEFINMAVHDNGTTDFDHGFYIKASNNLVEKSDIYSNTGWGVHIYNDGQPNLANDNIVRGNRIHDNAGAGKRGPGIILSSGNRNVAYNNLIWSNAAGIQIAYGTPTDSKVYNNTIYANKDYGIIVDTDAKNTIIENNILYQNGMAFRDAGTDTQSISNLIGVDPKFVDVLAHDFHLQPGSPAIDGGGLVEFVTTDFDGNARPQGSAIDLGAFEFINY